MSNIPKHRLREISLAVQRAYKDAEINLEELNTGVVPLYDLIRSYPIRVAEVQDLTPESIGEFLKTETGQEFPISEDENLKLAGYLYLQEYQGEFHGCILVEKRPSAAPISRRRFSAAHELGHYLLHFLPLLEQHQSTDLDEPLILTEGLYVSKKDKADNNDDETETKSAISETKAQLTLTNGLQGVLNVLDITQEQMEEEADLFAAELLIPEKSCFALAQRYSGRFGKKRSVLSRRLAPEFLVSNQAMYRRLGDLQLPEKLTHANAQKLCV
ncbi:MAG: ImmA/IrrE family metallo-endopeptidase [Halothece sp.]